MFLSESVSGTYLILQPICDREKAMLFDVVSFGETMLRFTPSAGERLEDTPTLRIYVAGSESNTLACLARLGLKTSWLSALPQNPLGKHVETELRRHGVNTDAIVWENGKTRLGIFYAEELPDPLGVQVYYDRADSACSSMDIERIGFSHVENARMLHLTGITPALSSNAHAVFTRLLTIAHDKRIPLSFDVNYRAKLWSATEAATGIERACLQADILFCTRDDAADIWGFVGQPEAVLRQIAQKFGAKHASKTFVLTLGSEGAAQLRDDIYSTAPAFSTSGTARFGSGDAFAAGYLFAYLEGSLYHELHDKYNISQLAFGNALAALKRCFPGDIAIVTPNEVAALLQKSEQKRFR